MHRRRGCIVPCEFNYRYGNTLLTFPFVFPFVLTFTGTLLRGREARGRVAADEDAAGRERGGVRSGGRLRGPRRRRMAHVGNRGAQAGRSLPRARPLPRHGTGDGGRMRRRDARRDNRGGGVSNGGRPGGGRTAAAPRGTFAAEGRGGVGRHPRLNRQAKHESSRGQQIQQQ